jgi:diguanylate cyclase
MIDVDHFKGYNDLNGHQGGDQALRSLGALLLNQLRASDMAARYGGEELCIIMPDTTIDEGVAIAERIRRAVARSLIKAQDGTSLPGITLSMGIVVSHRDDSVTTLISRADKLLYQAKDEGRDRCCFEKK